MRSSRNVHMTRHCVTSPRLLNAVSLSEVRNGCAALAIWLRVAACARTRRPSARQERLRGTQIIEDKWRKRVGVEPTGDRETCRPPVLKTGTITGPRALPDEPLCFSTNARSNLRSVTLRELRANIRATIRVHPRNHRLIL